MMVNRATALQSRDPEVAIPAAISLWILGRTDLLNLRWWTASDNEPSLRITIYALFKCLHNEDVDGWPHFSDHADRFADPERSRRRAEITTVEDNLGLFASTFADGLRANPSKDSRVKLLRTTYDRVAKKSNKTSAPTDGNSTLDKSRTLEPGGTGQGIRKRDREKNPDK